MFTKGSSCLTKLFEFYEAVSDWVDEGKAVQGVILERVTQQKDLGVVIDTGGKQAAQCQAAIGEANLVLGCILRGSFINQKRWC